MRQAHILLRQALLLLPVLAVLGCKEENTYAPPPPPRVTVATPAVAPVTEYLEATGTTVAVSAIDLVARVPGFLQAIEYQDGAAVRVGTRLFLIEQDQYQANLQQAEAQVQQQQAAVARAEAELARQQRLIRQNATAQAEVERWQSQRDQSLAALEEARAAVALARINLGYTEVKAPFDGIAGAHQVDVGALVGVGSPTKLASLVQLDPIHVTFSVNERDVLRVREDLAARGIRRPDAVPGDGPAIEIGLANESGFPHAGHVDYIAPQLDPTTGTLTVRGRFANPDRQLLPGLFVRVRVPVRTRPDALLVPEIALGSDQLGRYLLLAKPDGTIEQRPVRIGRQVGTLRVIESGIAATDQVVIGGLQRAIPGARVTVERGTIPPPPADPNAPAPSAAPAAPAPAAAPAPPAR